MTSLCPRSQGRFTAQWGCTLTHRAQHTRSMCPLCQSGGFTISWNLTSLRIACEKALSRTEGSFPGWGLRYPGVGTGIEIFLKQHYILLAIIHLQHFNRKLTNSVEKRERNECDKKATWEQKRPLGGGRRGRGADITNHRLSESLMKFHTPRVPSAPPHPQTHLVPGPFHPLPSSEHSSLPLHLNVSPRGCQGGVAIQRGCFCLSQGSDSVPRESCACTCPDCWVRVCLCVSLCLRAFRVQLASVCI